MPWAAIGGRYQLPPEKTLADNRPIGVFDSGVGGLTVLRSLHRALPGESTIYLGDLARCPYGVRPAPDVRGFALQIGDYLAAVPVKLLVIACNTATAVAYHDLKARYAFPVVGVVEPGAREAVRSTRSGRIGVVATEATVASGAYGRAIRELLPDAEVIERAASWLVPLIERGRVASRDLAPDLEPVISAFQEADVDVLILGCTHFPLVRDVFEAQMGAGVTVLDSAASTAAEVSRLLRAGGLAGSGEGRHRLLVTGPADAFAQRAQAMFHASPQIETVDAASLSGRHAYRAAVL